MIIVGVVSGIITVVCIGYGIRWKLKKGREEKEKRLERRESISASQKKDRKAAEEKMLSLPTCKDVECEECPECGMSEVIMERTFLDMASWPWGVHKDCLIFLLLCSRCRCQLGTCKPNNWKPTQNDTNQEKRPDMS